MRNGFDFDVMVIGGGGAGYAAASTAARHGAGVAMVENWKLGGTCLNVGCVPTKTLLRSAHVYELIKRAGEFGIEVSGASLDFAAVMKRKRDVIAGFSGEGPEESLRTQGITWLKEHAHFIDAHTLRVGGHDYTSDRFVVAAGSRPLIPALQGLQGTEYITSEGALELTELPRSIVIVGTGTVSCEFASLFRSFGSEVSVVGRRLLPREDHDLTDALAEAFARRGIRVVLGRAEAVASRDGGKLVTARTEDGRTVEVAGEALMLAAGRVARTDELNLEAAGVRTWAKGIQVDGQMRTSAPNIWAAGDITGEHMYTHSGDYGAEIAGWNAVHQREPRTADWRAIPRPVFSFPEFAAVGLTEKQAREAGEDVEVTRVRFDEVTKPIIDRETDGFVKVIARAGDGQILGAGIVGEEATTLISELVVAMAGHVSAWTVGDAIHPYPSLPEIVRWTADQVGKAREAEGHGKECILDISEPKLVSEV
ncbi:MAG: NAD(P)/FAD-dependent oxidoreductase [Chloroflexota bacterium]|nr:NAD(P)/FAD-dependent oxidoreductase [Chloroflexota bacterium]